VIIASHIVSDVHEELEQSWSEDVLEYPTIFLYREKKPEHFEAVDF
jgi:hypothetical protein